MCKRIKWLTPTVIIANKAHLFPVRMTSEAALQDSGFKNFTNSDWPTLKNVTLQQGTYMYVHIIERKDSWIKIYLQYIQCDIIFSIVFNPISFFQNGCNTIFHNPLMGINLISLIWLIWDNKR